MKSRYLTYALSTIRSEPQQLNQKTPPNNWCVIYAEANKGQYVNQLGKWSAPRFCWLDETLCPIKSSHIFTIYEETRFNNISQIENEMYAQA